MNGYGPMPGAGGPGQMWAPPHAAPWWNDPMAVLAVVLLAALIGVLVWGVLRVTGHRTHVAAVPPAAGGDAAGLELRLRYARGDISREDYLARGADLGLVPGPMPEAPPSQE